MNENFLRYKKHLRYNNTCICIQYCKMPQNYLTQDQIEDIKCSLFKAYSYINSLDSSKYQIYDEEMENKLIKNIQKIQCVLDRQSKSNDNNAKHQQHTTEHTDNTQQTRPSVGSALTGEKIFDLVKEFWKECNKNSSSQSNNNNDYTKTDLENRIDRLEMKLNSFLSALNI